MFKSRELKCSFNYFLIKEIYAIDNLKNNTITGVKHYIIDKKYIKLDKQNGTSTFFKPIYKIINVTSIQMCDFNFLYENSIIVFYISDGKMSKLKFNQSMLLQKNK